MADFYKFIEKHAKAVILVIVIITLIMGFFATKLKLNASYSAFMPWGEGSDTYEGGVPGQEAILAMEDFLAEEIELFPLTTVMPSDNVYASTVTLLPAQTEPDYPYSTNYIVLVESEDLYTAENLNLIQTVMSNLANRRELSTPTSVLDFITLEKNRTRLVTVPMNPNSDGDEWTDEEAETLETRIENDPIVKYFLVGGSGNSMMFTFYVSSVGNTQLNEFSELLKPLEEAGMSVYTNGGSVINQKVMDYLIDDLITLVSLCLVVILIIYYLSFRSKRSVLIPMSLSIIGLIWTFGTMALLDIDLTILNIVTPCMVLTLGSAYSIHVLSEYYASYRSGSTISPVQTTKKIFKTILLACLTTIGGFLCLCIAETQGLKEFGIAVSIGIGYCAILAVTYLPAILTIVPPPSVKQVKSYETGFMSKLVKAISSFVVKHWILLLVILVLITGAFFLVKDKISLDSNYMSYFPESDPFGRESRHFAAEMGGTNPFSITITAPEGADRFFQQSENLTKVWEFEEYIKTSPDVLQIISFPAYVSFANKTMTGEEGIPENNGLLNLLVRYILLAKNQIGGSISNLISDDGNQIALTMQHWDASEGDLMTVGSITRIYNMMVDNLDMLPNGTTVTISGDPVVNVKFSNRLLADQNLSTLLSLAVVFLIALITFRSLTDGLITIVPVLCGIMVNYIFMYLFNIPFDMVTVSFSSIAVGCGCDDAIHFMLRLKSQKKLNPDESYKTLISNTLIATGRPIILTTVSIVFGMMMLSFGSYTPIRYFGLLMSVTLTGCMVSTLIFLPPVAILINKVVTRIFRGRK